MQKIIPGTKHIFSKSSEGKIKDIISYNNKILGKVGRMIVKMREKSSTLQKGTIKDMDTAASKIQNNLNLDILEDARKQLNQLTALKINISSEKQHEVIPGVYNSYELRELKDQLRALQDINSDMKKLSESNKNTLQLILLDKKLNRTLNKTNRPFGERVKDGLEEKKLAFKDRSAKKLKKNTFEDNKIISDINKNLKKVLAKSQKAAKLRHEKLITQLRVLGTSKHRGLLSPEGYKELGKLHDAFDKLNKKFNALNKSSDKKVDASLSVPVQELNDKTTNQHSSMSTLPSPQSAINTALQNTALPPQSTDEVQTSTRVSTQDKPNLAKKQNNVILRPAPPPPSSTQDKPDPAKNMQSGTNAMNNASQDNAIPQPPPLPSTLSAATNLTPHRNTDPDREKLLNEIREGAKLKKVLTDNTENKQSNTSDDTSMEKALKRAQESMSLKHEFLEGERGENDVMSDEERNDHQEVRNAPTLSNDDNKILQKAATKMQNNMPLQTNKSKTMPKLLISKKAHTAHEKSRS